MNLNIQPVFFVSQSDFRKWLKKNHGKESELLVGFYKSGSGKPCMTWSESVDQAICFGWIDGLRKSINKESYFIRFTPRKSTSIWSAVNIRKVEKLTNQGLMQPSGIASFKLRQEHRSKIYSYEKEAAKLSDSFEKKFRANKKAWDFFHSQPPSYRKTVLHLIMSAKREITQLARLEKVILISEKGKRLL